MLNERLLGFDRVELTRHALDRMKQRKISREDVFQAIRKPDNVGLPAAPGRQRVRWNKSVNFSIDVVYELMTDRVRVITTFRVVDALRGVPPKVFAVKKPFRKTRRKGGKR